MRPLPPQIPDTPPRYRFRPRNDKGWHVPTLREPMPPREHAHPFETYDPRNEARPPTLGELRDRRLWIEGGLAAAILLFALIVVLSSGPMPTPVTP